MTLVEPTPAAVAGAPRRLSETRNASVHRVRVAAGVLLEAGIGVVFALAAYGLPVLALTQASQAVVAITAVLVCAFTTILLLFARFEAYLFFWIALVILQNMSVGLWLPDGYHGSVPLVITEMKTISLAIALLVSVVHIARFLRAHRGMAIAVGVYFVWVALSVRELTPGAFAYGRNFLFPLLLLLLIAAWTGSHPFAERVQILRRLIAFVVFVLTIGVLAEILIGTTVWRELLNVGQLEALGTVSEATYFLGARVERVAGFIVEPTNAGYIAAACAVLLILVTIAERKRPGLSWLLMFGLSLWLLWESSARSGLLMLALALVAVAISRARLRPFTFLLTSLVAAFAVVVVYVSTQKSVDAVVKAFSEPVSIVGGDSTTYHFAGLLSGIQEGIGRPWGLGLGVGGNFSTSLSEGELSLSGAAKVATGGESAWGVLSYQTGIIGLLLLIVVMLVIGRDWGVLSLTTLSIWSATAMFAEAAFGLQVASLLMIGAALLRTDGWQVRPRPETSRAGRRRARAARSARGAVRV